MIPLLPQLKAKYFLEGMGLIPVSCQCHITDSLLLIYF